MLDQFIVVFSLVLHHTTILIRFHFYAAFLSLQPQNNRHCLPCRRCRRRSLFLELFSSFFRSASFDLHEFSQCIYIKFFVLITTTLILVTFLVLVVLMIFFNVV
ncbi:hypothetical protein TorRG33x02_104000 [Trema orientale]|uniref:Transmembrane protein n=1 Tax=Trema orientale TaxID=63057 RepID=A0A2P5F7E6_TREOI|nr:hypothetical protein TorRG33x02_104000 [Trema orientale]